MKVTTVEEYQHCGRRIEGDGSIVVRKVVTDVQVSLKLSECQDIVEHLSTLPLDGKTTEMLVAKLSKVLE